MHLPQNQYLPMGGRKRPEALLNLAAELLPFCFLIGGGGFVRHVHIQLRVIQRWPCLSPVAPLTPEKVHTGVGSQPVQPGGKTGVSPKKGKALPRGKKRLLCGLGRVVRIATHADGQGKNTLFIAAHQLLKSVLISVAGGFNPLGLLLYVIACHVKSRLIPFVT